MGLRILFLRNLTESALGTFSSLKTSTAPYWEIIPQEDFSEDARLIFEAHQVLQKSRGQDKATILGFALNVM